NQQAFVFNKIAGGEVSWTFVFNHAWWNLKTLLRARISDRCTLVGALVIWEAIVFGCFVAVYLLVNRHRHLPKSKTDRRGAELCFHAFNIWAALIAIIFFYVVGNDGAWRVLSIHLLVSSLILITSTTGWLKAAAVGIVFVNVAAGPWCKTSIH